MPTDRASLDHECRANVGDFIRIMGGYEFVDFEENGAGWFKDLF